MSSNACILFCSPELWTETHVLAIIFRFLNAFQRPLVSFAVMSLLNFFFCCSVTCQTVSQAPLNISSMDLEKACLEN